MSPSDPSAVPDAAFVARNRLVLVVYTAAIFVSALLLFSVQHSWILGACKMPGGIMTELFHLWCERDRRDERFGTLVNAYLASGGSARAFPIGTGCVDVGMLGGWGNAAHTDVR